LVKEKNIGNYKEFVNFLDLELQAFAIDVSNDWKNNALKCVDGLAADELRRLVDLETRRKDGIFFTNSELAKRVFEELKPNFSDKSLIYDPACGAGNLLIAAHNFISKTNTKIASEKYLYGTDKYAEFVNAAKLRLSMNQLLISNSDAVSHKVKIVKPNFNIVEADGLKQNEYYENATHIIVNPPFNLVAVDEKLDWSKGKVSAAALFIDKIIQNISQGVSIYAILPDVLRSGSRYDKWRKMVEQNCVIGKTKLLGQFDKHADVDVFAIKLTKRRKSVSLNIKETKPEKSKKNKVIEDLFDVCVGPVVDNRDAFEGPNRKYIISKGLKGWTVQTGIKLTRKHKGKSFEGPFVVIKRTSRMGDSQRAIATIINIVNPVFVDNHLIILKPKSGTLKDCRKVLSILKDSKTDNWLNQKIRCRHLTVKIVSKVPLWQ
jgi:hypothetical protein